MTKFTTRLYAAPDSADMRHYWDAKTKLGRYLADILGQGDFPAWDIFLVYGPDASCGDRPDATGSPIISESGALEQALKPYLTTKN